GGWHSGQVSRAGSPRRPLLDGFVQWRGHPAWPRLPPLSQQTQRLGFARTGTRLPGLLAAVARGRLQDDRAHATRKRSVPPCRVLQREREPGINQNLKRSGFQPYYVPFRASLAIESVAGAPESFHPSGRGVADAASAVVRSAWTNRKCEKMP